MEWMWLLLECSCMVLTGSCVFSCVLNTLKASWVTRDTSKRRPCGTCTGSTASDPKSAFAATFVSCSPWCGPDGSALTALLLGRSLWPKVALPLLRLGVKGSKPRGLSRRGLSPAAKPRDQPSGTCPGLLVGCSLHSPCSGSSQVSPWPTLQTGASASC